MNFYQIRQTMTDDAYDIVSAFGQSASLTLQAIAYITGQREHATRFIHEQMAVFDVAVEKKTACGAFQKDLKPRCTNLKPEVAYHQLRRLMTVITAY